MLPFLIIITIVIAVPVHSQSFSAGQLLVTGTAWNGISGSYIGTAETTPLVIANTSAVGQPIQFYASNNGATKAMEIDAAANVWLNGSLSIGSFTGAAPFEQMRIGSIQITGGRGLVIDLLGTSTSSGLQVRGVGVTGSEDAGILLQSIVNGIGTGLRIGGPTGMGRPSFSTAIDITGGVGIRYNALSIGSGTAYEIGGTVAPLRGIEVTTAGAFNAGVVAKANSNGVGVLGMSVSGSYPTPPQTQLVGVRGHAATNSNIIADTAVGILGSALRGGSGGTMTTSIGVLGRSISSGTSHAGTAIGVVGTATASAPGIRTSIGGYFYSSTDPNSLALVATGADVFLGSSVARRPPALLNSTIVSSTFSTTYLYSADISGTAQFSTSTVINLVPGLLNDLFLADGIVFKLNSQNPMAQITGIQAGPIGRIITLICVNGLVRFDHESITALPGSRIRTPNGNEIDLDIDDSISLWYDADILRWRVISVQQ